MSRGAERSAIEAEKHAKVLRIRATEPGMTAPEIAERVGVNVFTVRRWLREARKAQTTGRAA